MNASEIFSLRGRELFVQFEPQWHLNISIKPPAPSKELGAIVRGEEVMIAHSHLTVESEDHLILFLVDKSKIKLVEKLFSVGFTFF